MNSAYKVVSWEEDPEPHMRPQPQAAPWLQPCQILSCALTPDRTCEVMPVCCFRLAEVCRITVEK